MQDYQHSVRVHEGSHSNIVRLEIYDQAKAIWDQRSLFDVQYQADLDKGTRAQTRAKIIMKEFSKVQLKWLKRQKAAYRISATYRETRGVAADFSIPLIEPEVKVVAMGYDIDVWFEDKPIAMLFKLTFGGNM